MATNPPPQQSPGRHSILGLPLWAWGLGLGAFALAVFMFFRQSQSGSATSTSTTPTGYGVPVPYPVPSNTPNTAPTPSQQQMEAIVKPWAGPGYEAWVIQSPQNVSAGPISMIPSDTDVPVTGPAVVGQPAGDPHHLTAWYPIQWGGSPGYISAADIGGFVPISNQFGDSVNNGVTPAPIQAAGGSQ